MRQVRYSDSAKQGGDGYDLLEKATQQLGEVLGQSAGLVTAEWDRGQDAQGRPVYTLKISDFTGEASARFAPDELNTPRHLRFRLHTLWGDLLQDRNHKQLQQL